MSIGSYQDRSTSRLGGSPPTLREQNTVLLVNHAFARVTSAIFVIFVISRGLTS